MIFPKSWWRWLYWYPLRTQYKRRLKGASTAFYYGSSIGDNVLLTSVVREWFKRYSSPVAVLTSYPELFDGLDEKLVVAPLEYGNLHVLQSIGVRGIYCTYDAKPQPGWPADYRPRGQRTILAEMLATAGITGEVELLPRIVLHQNELDSVLFEKPYVVLHSTSLRQTFKPYNKEWGIDKWRQLAEKLRGVIETVQVGNADDPVLPVSHDLRGGTSIRESAALVAKSVGVICQEGFLMHLSRAVDKRSITIYGGSQFPRHTGYSTNINLWRQPTCSPCFRLQECPQGQRICMEQISVAEVFFSVQEMIARRDEALIVDQVHIEPCEK